MNNKEYKENIKHILLQIQKIRHKVHISCEKLDEYFYYQHIKVSNQGYNFFTCGLCGKGKNQISSTFKRAFKTLSNIEKAEFYLMNVKNLQKIVYVESHKIFQKPVKILQAPKKLHIVLSSGSFFKKQTNLNIQVLKNQKIIKIIQNKIQIDLHNYLLRRSKNKSNVYLVLQATVPGPLGNTIRITNYGLDFDDVLNTISQLWQQAQYEYIEDIFKTNKNIKKIGKFQKPKPEICQQLANFDISKTVLSYSQQTKTRKNSISQGNIDLVKLQDTKQLQIIKTFVSYDKFQQINYGEYHQKNGLKVRKIIQFSSQNKDSQFVKHLIQDIKQNKIRKPTIKTIKSIANKTNGVVAVQQNHIFEQSQVQFRYLRKQIYYHGSLYIIQRPLDQKYSQMKIQNLIKANIQHCIWRIRQIGNKLQVFVQAKIQYMKNDKNYKKTKKFTSMFIGQLCKLLGDHHESKMQKVNTEQFYNQFLQCIEEQQFHTLPGSMEDQFYIEKVIKEQIKQQMVCSTYQQKKYNKNDLNEQNLLKHKFIMQPIKKDEPKLLTSKKGHWLFKDQWIVKQNGDLVNIDQEKINVQSNVLKLVIKRMGQNLFSGKSILNTSLPIQIFSTDSNLQRLAHGYIFAPTFLQKVAGQVSPLQRMKNVICFGVGYSLSYINMQKPFNPILGETYQGLIDGCPVYGQQISHHPPISSTYMIGRGYKVFGSLQAKVQLSLNTAAGVNQGFSHVIFENNHDEIKFTTPPGQLSGLIYGDRKIAPSKKSYYIDQKNKIFCQIDWGKNKNSKNQLSKFNDFFCGKIVKLKKDSNLQNYKNIKPSHVESELGYITGRLFQKVCFNNQIIFNIEEQNPFPMLQYSPCLNSDSRFRKDIIDRKQINYILAQQAKQQLQQIQRRDRRLRHQYSKQH